MEYSGGAVPLLECGSLYVFNDLVGAQTCPTGEKYESQLG